nr:hypothetical protein [Tanacetum cinerariifolium]
MAEPQSPNYVFDFSKDDPAHNEEEFKAESEEEPEEESEEAQKMDVDIEEDEDDDVEDLELIFPYEGMGSPNPPPHESDTSSDSEPNIATSATVGTALRCHLLSVGSRYHMNAFDFDLGVEEQFIIMVKHRVTTLEGRVQDLEGDEDRVENKRLKRELEFSERDRYELRVLAYGFYEETL